MFLVLVMAVLFHGNALASPRSIVSVPVGDITTFGDINWELCGMFGSGPRGRQNANLMIGIEASILPGFEYGHGIRFGGLEIGINALFFDLDDTAVKYVKPSLDAKLHLTVEHGWIPHLAVGILGVSPLRWNRSLNLLYGVVTKTLVLGGKSLGRITLGAGIVLGDFSSDPYRFNFPTFYASRPFSRNSRGTLLLGYESPSFGPFSIAIDHLGGVSEASATNLALLFAPTDSVVIRLAGWFGNDPIEYPQAGLLVALQIDFHVKNPSARKQRRNE